MRGKSSDSLKKKSSIKGSSEAFTVIVLAAGKGKRTGVTLSKVLFDLLGRPLIYYLLRELLSLGRRVSKIIVVVGHQAETVKSTVKKYFFKGISGRCPCRIEFIYQPKMLGTADAVRTAAAGISTANILIACADTPLLTSKTLSRLIAFFLKEKLEGCLLTAGLNCENSLGVVSRDKAGRIAAVREKNGLRPSQKAAAVSSIEEVNSGIYCFKRKPLLAALPQIKQNRQKREYFFTDIVEIFYRHKRRLSAYCLDTPEEILGINTLRDLAAATKIMRERVLDKLMKRGVKIVDPDTTFIEEGVVIGRNSRIYPFTFIEKDVIIGNNCSIGPFVRIRTGTSIADNVEAGNFLEINRSRIGRSTKVKHFGYLGDTTVADRVNIGAGTVVANYDGKFKQKSCIGRGAFIGSDTVLVAPVKIGPQAVTGAGSVVTKDVKPKTVVVGVPARPLKKKRG